MAAFVFCPIKCTQQLSNTCALHDVPIFSNSRDTTGSTGAKQLFFVRVDFRARLYSRIEADFKSQVHAEVKGVLTMEIRLKICLFVWLLFVHVSAEDEQQLLSDFNEYQVLAPRIFLPIIARNVEHSLPNWFGHLEKLDYPKDRIYLWYV